MTTHKNALALRHFNRGTVSETAQRENFISPAADIVETPEAYLVSMDLPGAARETMKVSIDRGTLDIFAPVSRTFREGATILHSEHATPGYCRSFTLGEGINHETIGASFENGVLTLKLLKAESAKPREITVR